MSLAALRRGGDWGVGAVGKRGLLVGGDQGVAALVACTLLTAHPCQPGAGGCVTIDKLQPGTAYAIDVQAWSNAWQRGATASIQARTAAAA